MSLMFLWVFPRGFLWPRMCPTSELHSEPTPCIPGIVSRDPSSMVCCGEGPTRGEMEARSEQSPDLESLAQAGGGGT